MKRNILRYTMTAAAFLLSGVLSINVLAQNNVSAYHAGSATPYATFQTLADALENGNLADNDIIELNADIAETVPSTISKNGLVIRSKSGGHYTVDLSSYTTFSTAVYTVAANDLNVSNITFANLKGNAGGDSGAIFHVRSNGTTTFGNKCIFQDNEVNISNGCCVLVKTPLNPALADKLGTVIVDGAQFVRNTGHHGAAVCLAGSRAQLIVNGETLFQENFAKSGCGGAVTVETDAICTVNSGTFTKNEGEFGGGIYLRGKLTVNGGKFIENKKAIVAASGFEEMIVNDGLFEGNIANYGPAIQFQSWGGTPGQAIINGGTFKDNIATVDGGAITIRCSNQDINLEVKGGVFTGNKAAEGCGGAINVIPGAKLTLTGGTFTGNEALKGNSIDQGGIMCLSGSPVFGDDQDVYLRDENITGICTYNVITKVGALGSSLKVPVSVKNMSAGRDILVSKSGATDSSNGKVIAGDSEHFSVLNSRAIYNATGLSSASSPYTPADVIETDGGPFLVVETATQYPTLQQAVDAAASGNTIKVLSGSEYDAATYSTDNPASYYREAWGGEVLIMGKSLTIIPEDSANPTPLKDFVFTVYGASTLSDIKFEGLKLTGKSKFMVFPGFAGQGINSLSIKNCDIDVNGGLPTSNRPVSNLLHLSGTSTIGFPNWSNGASIVFCGSPAGDIGSFEFAGNTYLNRDAGRCIVGRGRFRYFDIHDNTIGAEGCRFDDHFMTTEDGGYSSSAFTFRIHDNKFFSDDTAMLLWFTCGGFNNTQTNNVYVYDNEIDMTPAGRNTSQASVIRGMKVNNITGGKTTLTTYRNTVNGYCHNYIKVSTDPAGLEIPNSVVVNAQPGHTWDYGEENARIKDVPSGSSKNPDIYYNNKAYEYNEATGEFIEHDLGDAKYCDPCDELHVAPGLTIIANDLEEGQSAVFVVSRVDGDSDTPLLQVMIKGEAGGGGSRTVRGLEAGDYKVTPASWSWTYDIDEESIDVTLDGTNPAEAEFTLTKKDSTLPENVEKVKVNNF